MLKAFKKSLIRFASRNLPQKHNPKYPPNFKPKLLIIALFRAQTLVTAQRWLCVEFDWNTYSGIFATITILM